MRNALFRHISAEMAVIGLTDVAATSAMAELCQGENQ
jgi:hypothetical protein